jgi:hypothetical protein
LVGVERLFEQALLLGVVALAAGGELQPLELWLEGVQMRL